MKITFINTIPTRSPYLGLAYIITAVEKAGHKPNLIDLTFIFGNRLAYIIDEIKKQAPDIIGVSAITPYYEKSIDIVKKVKEKFPHLLVILGGIHPTIFPEEVISNSFVDMICIGEGEQALPELLDKLEKSQTPNVDGVWFKSNGKIIKNRLRPYNQDLDSLPFPNWDYWEIEKYFKLESLPDSLPILASRGCVFDCTFCSNKVFKEIGLGNYYRIRTPENIIGEIKNNIDKYIKRGLHNFSFYDDCFGLNRKQFDVFTELYMQEKIKYQAHWMCRTRADIITERWVQKAKAAGCVFVIMGLENSNEDIRMNRFKKNIPNSRFQSTAEILKRYNILHSINIMIGVPEDNRNTIKETVRFANSLRPITIKPSLYIPLPKTELEEFVRKKRLLREDRKKYCLPQIDTYYLKSEKLGREMQIVKIKTALLPFIVVFKKGGICLVMQVIIHFLFKKDYWIILFRYHICPFTILIERFLIEKITRTTD